MDISITNDNRQEVLNELSRRVEQALEAIGMTAESHAKAIAPVDTGRLRNSITHAVDMGEQAVYIGTNVEYAGYVELGTSRMKPQPYLEPAVVNYMSEYKTLAEQAFRG